jgi:hypothetical protein
MSRWFRFYAEALHDPKVQKLDGETFKAWVNLLCLASQHEGKLPAIEDIAFALRLTPDGALTVVERLLNGGLIDRVSGGPNGYHYAPHGWIGRQYKSDTSTERVKRFRDVSRNVAVTPPDTDTDTEQKEVDKSTSQQPAVSSAHAFAGRTVRLTHADFATWLRRYHAIPDLEAELASLDDWFQSETGALKKRTWFQTASGALNRKHQEAVVRQREAAHVDAGCGF